MKKIFVVLSLVFAAGQSFAQTQSFGKTLTISFIGNDFTTPQRLKTNTLATVLRNDQFSSIKNMAHGFAVTYAKGVSQHTDVAVTAGGSFANAPIGNKTVSQGDKFLVELDAAGHFKMLSQKSVVNPYLIAGVGASKYSNIFGAYVPLGGGFEFRVFNEAIFRMHFQYRVAVTTDANANHFQLGFGVGGFL